jgi:hypothetical protein
LLRTRAHTAVCLLALLASACTWSDPETVALAGVQPARAPNYAGVTVTISGSGFEPDVRVDFDRPDGSTVDAVFEVTLRSGAERIPLTNVVRLSSTALRATVPAGEPPGTYAVEVRSPQGQVATLPSAFVLFADAAPLARLTVSPGGGTADATEFALDASGTTDAEDPSTALQFRFDSNGDGAWTNWSPSPIHLQMYGLPGVYTAAVQVRDSTGNVATATVLVVVGAAGTVVRVTTGLDERDAGATPASPGGAGLSLREAIDWVNAQPTPKLITLAAPLDIVMTGVASQRGLTLTAPGAAVVGEPAVTLDFGVINQTCITLDGPGQRLVGVTLRGCDGTFVKMSTTSEGSQVAQIVAVPSTPYWAYGIEADSTSATTSWIGPGNDLTGLWIPLKVDGANYEVFGNRVHGNALGAKLSGSRVRVWQNVFSGSVVGPSLPGIGVEVGSGPGPVEILQNVFDGNQGGGLQAASVSGLTVRNNLFTGNSTFGMTALPAGLTHDHNGYFANGSGAVSTGLSTGTSDVLLDPLFVDAAGGDFRLLHGSPAIDAGIDTGIDVNGPVSGLFSGLAPDLGAAEMQ